MKPDKTEKWLLRGAGFVVLLYIAFFIVILTAMILVMVKYL